MAADTGKPDDVDLYDELSEWATERELIHIQIADLTARVAELEDLADFLPSLRELRAPSRGQRPLW